jgi:type IX secretion system PorP/SprF family membrane protein
VKQVKLMHMKRIYLVLGTCFISMAAMSQAKPFYTQYILNNYILNPAVAGIENYTDVKLSYRKQWAGIEGAPVTSYLSMHGPIGKSDYRTTATSFEVPGENPRGKSFADEYTAPAPHKGWGFTALNDRAGYINRWSVYGSFAYHRPLGIRTTLSAGFTAGLSSVSLDRSKIVWASLDPNDPAVGYGNNELKKITPELGAGLWLYGANYFIGASVLNIIPGKAKFVQSNKYGTYYTPNFFATAGYRFFLSDDISVLPSVMAQYWEPQLMGLHGNVKFQYQDKLWLGGSYRHSDLIAGYSAMAGVNISNTFNVSYAYENATTSRLRTYTRNTHEIVLGFLLGNKYGDTCPRNVW